MGRWLTASLLAIAMQVGAQATDYENAVKRTIEAQAGHTTLDRERPVAGRDLRFTINYGELPPPPGYTRLSAYHEQAPVEPSLDLTGLSQEERDFKTFQRLVRNTSPTSFPTIPGVLTLHAERRTDKGIERIIIKDILGDGTADAVYIGTGSTAQEAQTQLHRSVVFYNEEGAQRAKEFDYKTITDWIRRGAR